MKTTNIGSKFARKLETPLRLLLALVIAFSSFSLTIPEAASAEPAGKALQFNGLTQYVTIPSASALNTPTFTIETWLKRTGDGIGVTTGGGGIASAIPLIAKGTSEGETAPADVNYFFGIDASSGKLVADFEEAQGQPNPSLNHPITGNTLVTRDIWHHAAVTYDGTTWKLYLDGALDGTLAVGRTPNTANIGPVGLAASIRSNGTTIQGYFAGVLDETRIWNVARTQEQISLDLYSQLTTGTNLVARWGMNEGTGTTVASSVGSFTGTLKPTGSEPLWVTGFPDNVPPAAPTSLSATGVEGAVNLAWTAPADFDIAGYNVYRGTATGFTPGASLNVSLIQGTTYSDTTGTVGTKYYYVVKAVDTSGNSSTYSNEANGIPLADSTPPSAPIGLTAIPGNARVSLSWNENTEPDKAGYNVYQYSSPSTYTKLNSSILVTPTYLISNLSNGTLYTYVVTSVDTHSNESGYSDPSSATPVEPWALSFDGTNDYVTFGQASGLGLQTFTIETWVKRKTGGKLMGTGTGGLGDGFPQAYPVITKGRGQAETPANYNMNYWVGIASTGVIAADFEDTNNGLNHPVLGTTPMQIDEWHHIAVTFGGGCWKIYLDGKLETLNSSTIQCPKIAGSQTLAAVPESTSIQHAALATALQTGGNLLGDEGFFSGEIDEVRIWNHERTQSEIRASINSELNSGSGLVARWGMIEGLGSTIASSVGTFPGTLTNGPAWVTYGAPFNVVLETNPPSAPTSLSALPGNSQISLSWTANTEPDKAGYNVYRSISSPVTLTSPINGGRLVTTNAYLDSSVVNGTTYYYVVTAVDTSGNESGGSAQVSAAPFVDTTPPDIPTGLIATPGNARVSLNWTANTELDMSGYNIYQFNDPTYTKINTSLFTGSSYLLTNLSNGTGYSYVITAVDTTGNESLYSALASATPVSMETALQFTNASGTYVTFGDPAKLDLATFTIETWFKRTGVGTAYTTGDQGILLALPLVTHGSPQADGSNVDADWVLVINDATDVIGADFEDSSTGLNHPVSGVTPIENNKWYHTAATYDGTTWKLYLNGNLETTLVVGAYTPRSDTIQQAGLGTMIESGGTPHGYFQGILDEARVWNVARTRDEIRADINSQLTTGTGLVARWGLNEGIGTVVDDSITSAANGTIVGNNFSWVTGAPFNLTFDSIPPAAPTGLTANGGNSSVSLDWNDNTDPDLLGYNVYRSQDSTPFTKINSTIITLSAYSDTGLVNGQEYFYVVRAVDRSGNESTDSNKTYSYPMSDLGAALEFTGTTLDSYVTFGNPAKLGLTTFTIETWFKRTGAGTAITTGGGGIANAIPLVSHGAQQSEGGTVDANWMLVIDDDTDVIAADFEDMATGLNHPVRGTTPITSDVWHHAAATYDGATWKLYLDGKLEGTLAANATPRSDTAQHAALGTMLNTTVGTNGFFEGVIDESRVWNRALTQTEILSNLNKQITSGNGLVARWGMNEGGGTIVADSITSPTTADGTIMGSNYIWVPGAPFNLDLRPGTPVLMTPANAATNVPTTTTLTVTANDARNSELTVSFYGRPKVGTPGADFSLIAIPDPQEYAALYPNIYNAQMNWVVTNKTTSNIPYVVSLGDNVDTSTQTQWSNAMNAWDILTTGGVPYGLTLGNHDGAPSTTTAFNTAFGSRISSQSTYGGRYGTADYDNTYAFFSASGMNFVVLFIEYDDSMTSPSNPVLVWANGILQANNTKRAIVVTHNLLNGNNFTGQGSAIYEALKGNTNLFLMLGGHLDITGSRTDSYNGNTVYSLRSDYQFVDNSQSGYLRIMRFSPTNNRIYVTTYSPTQNKSLTDTANQFDLAYTMASAPAFTLINTVTVPAGDNASVTWSGLSSGTEYEWYAVSTNGGGTASSPTWSFTSAGTVPVTLSYFKSERQGNQVKFDWSTSTETANVGFNLYVEKDGVLTLLNDELIASRAVDSLSRLDYTLTAKTDGEVFYFEDVSVFNETRLHGPFQLGEAFGVRTENDQIVWSTIQNEHQNKHKDQQSKLTPELESDAAIIRSSANLGIMPFTTALSGSTTSVNLKVSKSGIYRVTYEMLRDAGYDLAGVQTKFISLTNRGKEVPLYTTSTRTFGAGGYFEFYGQGLDSIYTDTNIYTVQVKATAASRITFNTKLPGKTLVAPTSYMETLTVNNQKAYGYYAPGADAWYDTSMLVYTTPKSWNFPFTVSGLTSNADTASLDLTLWGITGFSQTPDHHVRVSINGVSLGDEYFDALVEQELHVEFPAGTLVEGTNTLQLTLPGDTGASYDMVNLDKFSVTYPRGYKASEGQLTFTAAAKSFKVTNLPAKDVVIYRLSQGSLVRLAATVTQVADKTYTAAFLGDSSDSTYLVNTTSSLNNPVFEIARAKVDLSQPAQYLIISHPDFISGLQPLVTARQAQGLSVKVVDVTDVYAQYSYGIFDPQAIKEYIKDAKANLGTQYVLLVGGDTYDYRNYLGINSISFIPSLYIQTSQVARLVPVDPFYTDVDGDMLPDLAIGRFPVRTPAELSLMVKKTLVYGTKDYGKTAIFAADKQDGALSFKEINDDLARSMPAGWMVENINLDDTSVATAQNQLLAGMNRGTALVNFIGHSATTSWTFSGLFNTTKAAGLTNIGRPFVVVQWGCWNTYFVDPKNNYLVQSLLFSGEQGAAVVLGATTLTEISSEQMLGQLLTPNLVSPGMTIGQAVQDAKAELGQTHPEMLDVLLGWSLMGDPALMIQP